MYAIIRRYTPNVVEGNSNECFADLTGLRTFLKMTYKEMTLQILNDLKTEIGITCTVRVTTVDAYLEAKNKGKKSKNISTYKEMNKLFKGSSYVVAKNRTALYKRKRLTVPFLGKVA